MQPGMRKVIVVYFFSFCYTFSAMLKNLLAKIIDYNSNLTVRVRLVALTVAAPRGRRVPIGVGSASAGRDRARDQDCEQLVTKM